MKKTKPTKPVRHRERESDALEIKIHGVAACLTLWQKRPQDVIRIYLREDMVPVFSVMLKWAAEQRKAYHIVKDQDLESITDSVHHQGVCVLARKIAPLSFSQFRQLITPIKIPQLLLYLDGVENPHNLGALLRSCAHFGVRYVLGAANRLPALSPSAYRVAEGGAEYVRLVQLTDPIAQLRQLKELGFALLATRATQATSLYQHQFTEKTVLILGAEVEGISDSMFKHVHSVLCIPGSGEVESLNVSVAGAVAMAECFRQLSKA